MLSLWLTVLLIFSGNAPLLMTAAYAAEGEEPLQLSYTVNEIDSQGERKKLSSLPQPTTTPLPQAQIEAMLGKLKSLQAPSEQKLVLPEDSLIRPLIPGTQIIETFPPKLVVTAPVAKKPDWKASPSPLKVSRISHDGLVDEIEQFAITFSQPIVALGQIATVQPDKFVTISPQPEGEWKWAGTQTILFNPKGGRFPKATKYVVTVPATAKSVSGNAIEKAVTYTILTPPAAVTTVYPNRTYGNNFNQSTTPVIIAQFNQAIDPKKILEKTCLLYRHQSLPIRLLDKSQLLTRDDDIKAQIPDRPSKFWIAFEPTAPLPMGAVMTVLFGLGLPSLEGPLLGDKYDSYDFRVHDVFKLVNDQVKGSAGEGGYAQLELTNPINSKTNIHSMISITPEVELLRTAFSENRITLQGRFKPMAHYKVTLSKSLTDKFGQALGRDTNAEITTALLPYQISPDRPFKTYTSDRNPKYSVWVQGAPSVKIEIRRVAADDLLAFQNAKYRQEADTIGQMVHTEEIQIGLDGRQIDLDLKPYLSGKHGHLMVRADLPPSPTPYQQHLFSKSWIQVTDIGLDAFDSRELEILATNLKDASPLPGVHLHLSGAIESATSDNNGQAELPLITDQSGTQVLLASTDSDSAVLIPNEFGGNWRKNEVPDAVRWYTVSDRNLYKPAEDVIVKGWLRQATYNQAGGLKLTAPKFEKLYYQINDSTGVEVGNGECAIDQLGGFSYHIKLPEKLALGNALINMTLAQPQDSAADHAVLRHSAPVKIYDGLERQYRSQVSSDQSTSLSISIQEFRRPEFEINVVANQSTPLILGDSASVTSTAKYLVGGALAGTPVHWVVRPSVSQYSPPGWSGFNFSSGFDLYNWYNQDFLHHRMPPKRELNNGQKTLQGTSDFQGRDSIELKFLKVPKPVPMSYLCQATVVDVNRQNWTSSTSLLVHPADIYVGIKKDKYQYLQGEPVILHLVAADLEGKIKQGIKVNLEIAQTDINGATKSESRFFNMGSSPSEIRFTPGKTCSSFTATAHIKDLKGRENICADSGSVTAPPKKSDTTLAEIKSIKLTADKAEYKAGDVAKVTIECPFAPARGVFIQTRNRNISNMPLVLEGPTKTIEVPITEDHYPDIRLEVYLASESTIFATGSLNLAVPPKPRRLKLSVLPAQSEIAPGKDTTLKIDLKDGAGEPLRNGQVAVAVVDEAVLALTNYKWQDPMEFFYPSTLPQLLDAYCRQYVVLTDKQLESTQALPVPPVVTGTVELEEYRESPFRLKEATIGGLGGGTDSADRYTFFGNGGRAEGPRDSNMFQVEPSVLDERHYSSGRAERHQAAGGTAVPDIYLRQNFSALAVFKAAVITDANGKAEVPFTLPDNVTRYRVMAVAVAGNDQFGSSESTLTTKMPMMVKPSPPRFLQLADRCELPVVIQNQTDKPLQAQIAMRAENAQILEGGKSVLVPANDRVEVRFATVATGFGNAQFQCAAISGEYSDAAEFSLPVMVPASSEAFAAYGVVDKGMTVQKLDTPKDVFPSLGGLSIETSSTAVQSLTDAYIYLRDYPYSCSEQISSRLIAMLSLQDALTAFGILKGDEQSHYKSLIQSDIDVLEKRQGSEGGFGLWTAGEATKWPYVSIQVTRALHLAKSKDYKVNESCLTNALTYLKNIEQYFDSTYTEPVRVAILARALNVRHLAKDNDPAAAKALFDRAMALSAKNQAKVRSLDTLPADRLKDYVTVEMASWLLVVLDKDEKYQNEAKALRSLIQTQIRETASTASANESSWGDEWNYLIFASPRRTDAAVLEALMEDQPESDLIPKFVKGLLAHRKNGAWQGTQENGYILQTLDRYFNTYEKDVPNFVAQTWLGATLLANHKFVGRTTESKISKVPMAYLLKNPTSEILIDKQGLGRLYYRLALDYVPKNLNLKALDQGFTVSRTYLPVDAKDDVRKDAEGTWHFKSGAAVKVKVHFKNIGARYHVAMMDPLPAGAEPVNTALQGTRTTVPTQDWQKDKSDIDGSHSLERYLWWRTWYEHDNLRDHQAEAFTSLLPAGEYDYTYTIQATTPGHYTVPPTKVEEMYQSETFGRTQTEIVVIE